MYVLQITTMNIFYGHQNKASLRVMLNFELYHMILIVAISSIKNMNPQGSTHLYSLMRPPNNTTTSPLMYFPMS